MSRPETWTTIEDYLILAAHAKNIGNAAIAQLMAREGYGKRGTDSVRGRLRRLLGKEPPRSECGNIDQHRIDYERNKRADESYQRAMQREGYRQHCSTKAGTDSPKIVAPVSVGSCTSSAGWAV